MCERGISLTGRPDSSVTCGTCSAYELCNLPEARERRQQGDNLLKRFPEKNRRKLVDDAFSAPLNSSH